MIPPNWNILNSNETSARDLSNHIVSADFRETHDVPSLHLVIRHCQRLLAVAQQRVFPCKFCGKKFDSSEHLDLHSMRRHPLSGAESAASAETAIITSLITETRDFLADEIRVAVKAALQAQAAVPVGVSFTGDLEISGLSASPDISN
jgi:hypothetical protein